MPFLYFKTTFVIMIKKSLILILSCFTTAVFAQKATDSINTRYLEDQLYITFVYNILNEKPQEVSQNGFSGGVSVGFIKDLPINKARNIGFGIGIGYSYEVYIQNLKIEDLINHTSTSIATDYNINKFRIHAIEMPLEFRWRTSTPTKYKFWRVYGGVKLMYAFDFKSTYKDSETSISVSNISAFNKFQTGVFISAGFSTWNLHIYYGLTPLFNNLNFQENEISMKEMNIGLKFYIM